MDEHPQEDRLHYPNLTIRGFRAIKDFTATGLGRVTLITGMNNSGKSSILEALYLHATNAAPHVLNHILSAREEADSRADQGEFPVDPGSLFHGFPQLSDDFEPIAISTEGQEGRQGLTIRVDWFAEERDSDGRRKLVPGTRSMFGDYDYAPVLVVETEEGSRLHRIDYSSEPNGGRRLVRPVEARMPCAKVNPYDGVQTGVLEGLWSGIALTDSEDDVVEALRIIDPGISAVSMVVGDNAREDRIAIVRSADFSRPVPLRSFGDGMARIFAIVLSLVNARGGLLLIDEFENGLHHGVLIDVWRTMFRLAKRLDVQVFAASHSWDALEAFQKAAAEVPEEGSLLRLTRRFGNVIPTLFPEDDLAIATRHRIEVR
jgi:ABC-type branched-subunit amino acid transport system ATPase component